MDTPENVSGVHPTPTAPDPVADAILAQNNGFKLFLGGVIGNPLKGTLIHKIDAPISQAVAEAVKSACAANNLPIPYALGCLAIESLLDPACENGNFLGSNKTKDPLGYDIGIAQLKLRYLIGQPGVTDAVSAKAFAFDVEKAVNHFAREMVGLLAYAKVVNLSGSAYDPRSHNPYFFATCAYNFGRTGVLTVLASGEPINHGDHVIHLETAFAKRLNMPSVFSDIIG